MKRLGMVTVVLVIIVAALLLLASSCIGFGTKQATADAFFAGKPHQPRYQRYRHDRRDIFFVDVGQQDRPPVVFVHGSPGGWGAFMGYMDDPSLLAKARLISVDRPGFGGSGRGKPERSLAKQAADLKPILERNRSGTPAILVGHSLGGPVIARMAMDYPELVGGLIMVSPSIDPELEKLYWFQIPADWLVFSWMIPRDWVTSNREILPLKRELTDMLPLWERVQTPVTVIHGEKDRLVPVANADFAERVLTHVPLKVLRYPDLNHFVPWTRPDLVRDAILSHLENLSPSAEPGDG